MSIICPINRHFVLKLLKNSIIYPNYSEPPPEFSGPNN